MTDQTIRCSVGITAYNEEANIGRLLQAILDQQLSKVEIAQIVVVPAPVPTARKRSCGSSWPRIRALSSTPSPSARVRLSRQPVPQACY